MKIYVACPYSHESPKVREKRFWAANKAAGWLMRQGHVVYSPISHSHPIAVQCDLPKDWEYWQKVDEFFISVCDALYILAIPGWDKSIGIDHEVEIADKLEKPTYLMFEFKEGYLIEAY